MLIVPTGTCESAAEALVVVDVGGVGVGVLPGVAAVVGVVAAVAVGACVAVGKGVAVGTFGVATVVGGVAIGLLMVGVPAALPFGAADWLDAAPTAGAATSASRAAANVRLIAIMRLAIGGDVGCLYPFMSHPPFPTRAP
jgi:hypothetical protein